MNQPNSPQITPAEERVQHSDTPPNEAAQHARASSWLARTLTALVEWCYLPLFRAWLPRETFRYGVCGGANLVLNWVIYALLYNVIINKQMLSLLGGGIVISPHIAAFLVAFPITFLTGFWLQRNVTFQVAHLPGGTQLFRYLLTVSGSVLLNYLLLKLFVEVLSIYPTPSQMLTSLVTIAYSYVAQKYFTFRTLRAS